MSNVHSIFRDNSRETSRTCLVCARHFDSPAGYLAHRHHPRRRPSYLAVWLFGGSLFVIFGGAIAFFSLVVWFLAHLTDFI